MEVEDELGSLSRTTFFHVKQVYNLAPEVSQERISIELYCWIHASFQE